jgi:hypothetical protein
MLVRAPNGTYEFIDFRETVYPHACMFKPLTRCVPVTRNNASKLRVRQTGPRRIKRRLVRDRRKSKTANRSTAICGGPRLMLVCGVYKVQSCNQMCQGPVAPHLFVNFKGARR